MLQRLILGSALGLAIAAAPGAALAKPVATPTLFTSADLERIVPPLDPGCILGPAAKSATPDQVVDYCTTAIAAVEARKLTSKTASERAGLSFVIASLDFARAGAYVKIDGVRSARTCTSAERVFVQMLAIDVKLFDPELADSVVLSRGAISRSVAACRKDFGTAAGAPALLPG